MSSIELEPDRKDLKIQALLEKISNLVATYENNEADLRVRLTEVVAELEALKKEHGVQEAEDKPANHSH